MNEMAGDSTKGGFDPARLIHINQMMQRYVAAGKSAGMLTLLSYRGKIHHLEMYGYQNLVEKTPIREDTIFRIYSMTKPITSVALMMLFERGHFHLEDKASHWIPQMKHLQVYRNKNTLDPLESDITIRQLLTHTAGFSYGFEPETIPVDKLYKQLWDTLDFKIPAEAVIRDILAIPLMAQPGNVWHYSVATDICGYLVELMSDMPLGDYLRKYLFDPLGMQDTTFQIDAGRLDRLATLYGATESDPLAQLEPNHPSPFVYATSSERIQLHSGGMGLLSTARDYWLFSQMMLNGGQLDGQRILSRKTVELMTMNHLPRSLLPVRYNGVTPESLAGYGFGLGYSITLDPSATGALGSQGDFGWGGVADTYCWIDKKEDIIGILLQQFIPSMLHAGRRDFRNAAYQALT